jgi:Leucine-rich repeat (LRR) protein
MTNLQNISFQFNRLESIEANAFEGLDNLQDLSFHRNKLTSFDHVILTGPRIENLNLSSNNFVIVKSDYINVETLDLSSNKLKFLDIIYFNSLILNNNNLKKLNISIKKSQYELISLESNNIIEFTNKTIENI